MSDDNDTTRVEYREIPECPGFRFGSDGTGWAFRPCTEKGGGPWVLLSVYPDKRGFNKRVYVRIDGQRQRFGLITLVCWAFHGPCPDGLKCRRIDGDAANDCADNLEWGSWEDDLARGRKRCAKCRVVRPLSEFQGNPYTFDRLTERCKACLKEYRLEVYSRPEARAKRRTTEARASRKYNYGLTPQGYEALLEAQSGVCAICGKPPKGGRNTMQHVVDHDHSNGVIRGLLCGSCNTAIGQLGDNLEGLMKAVAYLQRQQP
jgi:hypothetical protein